MTNEELEKSSRPVLPGVFSGMGREMTNEELDGFLRELGHELADLNRGVVAIMQALDAVLRGVCRRHVTGEAAVDDALQDLAAKLTAKLKLWDRKRPVRPWVLRVLRNGLVDKLRRSNPRVDVSFGNVSTPSLPTYAQRVGEAVIATVAAGNAIGFGVWVDPTSVRSRVARDEERRLVSTALARLPDEYAAAVWLCDAEELGERAAAEALGLGRDRLRTLLKKGRALLRVELESLLRVAPAACGEVVVAGEEVFTTNKCDDGEDEDEKI